MLDLLACLVIDISPKLAGRQVVYMNAQDLREFMKDQCPCAEPVEVRVKQVKGWIMLKGDYNANEF